MREIKSLMKSEAGLMEVDFNVDLHVWRANDKAFLNFEKEWILQNSILCYKGEKVKFWSKNIHECKILTRAGGEGQNTRGNVFAWPKFHFLSRVSYVVFCQEGEKVHFLSRYDKYTISLQFIACVYYN